MNLAERYRRLLDDPAFDGHPNLVMLAVAQSSIPGASLAEQEHYARLLAPDDASLMAACGEIQTAGGAE